MGKVLVACEYSGKVRDAFIAAGHDAISCDFLPTDRPGPHYEGDVFNIIDQGFDLMIAHPPCTYLAGSGARWMYDSRYPNRWQDQNHAVDFFLRLWNADIPRIAIENPIGVMSKRLRKPDQYIQPWQYGHPETKKTCLWLKNLPQLEPTEIVEGREQRIWNLGPSEDRWKLRSETYQGWADAMAQQWGAIL